MIKAYFFGILAIFSLFYFINFNDGVVELSSINEINNYTAEELYYEKNIQPILTQRCAVCHSCANAPCQMNLASYEGFLRGANKRFVYQFDDSQAAPLTRLGIDAHTVEDWRNKNFYPIYDPENPQDSIITNLINMKKNSTDLPKTNKEGAGSCPANQAEIKKYMEKNPHAGMPYGLPKLSDSERNVITNWLSNGARGPSWEKIQQLKKPTLEAAPQIEEWERFFNTQTLKNKLVSRYLYEHLFLAHLYFPEKPTEFYSLVRSKSVCSKGVDVISSRRPSDDPGTDGFFYCLQKFNSQIVNKTHLPYEISRKKLKRIKDLFFTPAWNLTNLPPYDGKIAANPFITFHAIPARSRYQFLLDDAQYHINTFIKGPVCFGNSALNSIDEQFFTFFIHPDSDFISNDQGFETEISPNLFLPSYYDGSELKLLGAFGIYDKMVDQRERYRKQAAKKYREKFPKGYGLSDIWDGDKTNDNAVLTVLRHRQSSTVMKGIHGDLSKTAFVLDYSLFERLVYNLVVGYDVYGSLGHQVLSRIYMDFIRMEAEENYLLFMPRDEVRKDMRKHWYRGLVAHLKMKFWYEHHNLDMPTQLEYENPERAQAEFTEKLLFERMTSKVRGPIDLINWKKISVPQDLVNLALTQYSLQEQMDMKILKNIASIKVKDKPFSAFFPDISFLQVVDDAGKSQVYSIIHHREHYNLSAIILEDQRRDPEIDSLSVYRGYVGAFPNMFFIVKRNDLESFVNQIETIKTQKDYDKFEYLWGISRTNEKFWQYSDWFFADANRLNPSDSGLFDLTRYGNSLPDYGVNHYFREVAKKNQPFKSGYSAR